MSKEIFHRICSSAPILDPDTNLETDSSPISYIASSSPARGLGRSDIRSDIRSDALSTSSGLFVSPSGGRRGPRRSDLHSSGLNSTPARRNRLFVGPNGMPAGDNAPRSDATFSNINPGTSEAEAMAGNSTRVIWGTNVSIHDSMSAFKNFLYNFATKYRLWADGASEAEVRIMGDAAEKREYITMMNDMRRLGLTTFNLDCKNLKAYPLTKKLWHQLLAYPQEIVPLMDQAVKDVMVDLALKEMDVLRSEIQRGGQSRDRRGQSILTSDGVGPAADVPDLVQEVESVNYKVLPFGLDQTINMRDLDPAGECCEALPFFLDCRSLTNCRHGQAGQHQGFGHSYHSYHSRHERW